MKCGLLSTKRTTKHWDEIRLVHSIARKCKVPLRSSARPWKFLPGARSHKLLAFLNVRLPSRHRAFGGSRQCGRAEPQNVALITLLSIINHSSARSGMGDKVVCLAVSFGMNGRFTRSRRCTLRLHAMVAPLIVSSLLAQPLWLVLRDAFFDMKAHCAATSVTAWWAFLAASEPVSLECRRRSFVLQCRSAWATHHCFALCWHLFFPYYHCYVVVACSCMKFLNFVAILQCDASFICDRYVALSSFCSPATVHSHYLVTHGSWT